MIKKLVDTPLVNNICRLMTEQKLTVHALARKAGVNHFTIHNLFRVLSKSTSADKLDRIARALGVISNANYR